MKEEARNNKLNCSKPNKFKTMGNRKQRRQLKRLFKKVSNIILRKKDPRNQTLQELFNSFNNQFIAPDEFQRPLSWGPEQKEKYFWSILMNRIEGTIVVVNIRKALATIYWLLSREILIHKGDLKEEQDMKYEIDDFETKIEE